MLRCLLIFTADSFSSLYDRYLMSHCLFIGITDSFSSYESYYMSGTSDPEYSSDSGSMEAFGAYHYDVRQMLSVTTIRKLPRVQTRLERVKRQGREGEVRHDRAEQGIEAGMIGSDKIA